MALRSTTIRDPSITPIPIPTRSAVLSPVVEVLMALGAVIVDEVGSSGCDVGEDFPEATDEVAVKG